MGKNVLIAVALVIVAVGGYFLLQNKGAMTTPGAVAPTAAMTADETPQAAVNPTVVELAELNDSKQIGAATLSEVGGKVVVSINIPPSADSVKQPAHIHVGECPTPGAVKYPLTNVDTGISMTTLDVSMAELKAMLPLAINVHKSAEEASVYTSCGNIK